MNGGGQRVAIVGAGRMGQGMALAFACGGVEVALIDARWRDDVEQRRYIDDVRADLHAAIDVKVRRGWFAADRAHAARARLDVIGRADADAALAAADLIFEAVPEVLDAKREVFAWLSEAASLDTPIASTTSSFLVTELAEFVVAPERFLNAHWLNPADLMPLVEISRGDLTADSAVDRTRTLVEAIGKIPVVCSASPGYIVPRIQALAMNEAARMVEEGVASAEDIDTAIRVGFGLRFAVLGLLEFIDWGGGDILHYASEYLSEHYGERFSAPNVIATNMTTGRNGLRDGRGFYEYEPDTVDDYRERRMSEFARLLTSLDLMPKAA